MNCDKLLLLMRVGFCWSVFPIVFVPFYLIGRCDGTYNEGRWDEALETYFSEVMIKWR